MCEMKKPLAEQNCVEIIGKDQIYTHKKMMQEEKKDWLGL